MSEGAKVVLLLALLVFIWAGLPLVVLLLGFPVRDALVIFVGLSAFVGLAALEEWYP